jgi:hypothetical protein
VIAPCLDKQNSGKISATIINFLLALRKSLRAYRALRPETYRIRSVADLKNIFLQE